MNKRYSIKHFKPLVLLTAVSLLASAFCCMQPDSGFSAEINGRAIRKSNKRADASQTNDIKIPEIKPVAGFNLMPQIGHAGNVKSIAIDKKNRYLVSGSSDRTIKLWDLKTGALIRNIPTKFRINAVTIDPNGLYVVSAGYGNDGLQLYDLKSGSLMKTYKLPHGDTWRLSFDITGHHIIAGMSNATVVLVNAANGTISKTFDVSGYYEKTTGKRSPAHIQVAETDPSGQLLVTNGIENDALIWDLKTGKVLKKLSGHDLSINCAVFDKSGQYLVTGSSDKTVNVWDIKSGSLLRTLTGHEKSKYNAVRVVAIDHSGKYIISGDAFGQIRIWDLKTGKTVKVLQDGKQGILALIVLPFSDQIITGGRDYTIKAWNIKTGVRLNRFTPISSNVMAIAVDAKERYLVSGGYDAILRLWDLQTGKLLKLLMGHEGTINDLAITPDGRFIISGSSDKTLRVWSLDTGKMIKTLKGHEGAINTLAVNTLGTKCISGSDDGTLRQWSIKSGALINTMHGHTDSITSVLFTPQGNKIISGSTDGTIRYWDSKTGRVLKTIMPTMEAIDEKFLVGILALAIHSGENYLVSSTRDFTLKFWELNSGDLIHSIKWDDIGLSIAPAPSGDRLFSGSLDGSIKLWDIRYEDIIKSLKPINAASVINHELFVNYCYSNTQTSGINDLQIISNGNRIISGNHDGTITIWNVKNNTSYQLISHQDKWAMFTPDGYFDASPHGGDMLKLVNGLQVYAVDQFVIRNNRPDIILERIGLCNKSKLNHFRSQFLKRLRRSGLSLKVLAVNAGIPRAKILQTHQNGNIASMEFLFNGNKSPLMKYNIYVNDVPLFGSYGKNLSGDEVRVTEQVELTYGKNKIEISCINNNGIESLRDITYLDYNRVTKGDLYYIGFGVSKYRNSQFDLKYADKDVSDLEALLPGMISEFNTLHSRTFLNQHVTVENIKKVKSMLQEANVNDTVILFVAGHGMYDTDDASTYYFLTHNTDLDNLKGTAAAFNVIEEILQGIRPRKKLFLIDTCESGEKEESYMNTAALASNSRGIVPRTARAITLNSQSHKTGQFVQKDRYIYNDMLRRSGAVIFSSSKGNEYSYESNKYKNGLFTEAVIDALTSGKADTNHDYMLSTQELRSYVTKKVLGMSGGLQTPSVDRDNIYEQIQIPISSTQ